MYLLDNNISAMIVHAKKAIRILSAMCLKAAVIGVYPSVFTTESKGTLK